jgi:hypothetical protein
LAKRKWPLSCSMMITPKTKMVRITVFKCAS